MAQHKSSTLHFAGLCSRCDRGNRYCRRQCRRPAREQARRETAQRYQRSWHGRIAHAQRSRFWRQRRAARDAASGTGDDAYIVTQQGCRSGHAWAPLVVWTHDSATVDVESRQPTSRRPVPCWSPTLPRPRVARPAAAAALGRARLYALASCATACPGSGDMTIALELVAQNMRLHAVESWRVGIRRRRHGPDSLQRTPDFQHQRELGWLRRPPGADCLRRGTRLLHSASTTAGRCCGAASRRRW